jgi:hypothetical protein
VSDQSKYARSTDPRINAALREYLERVDRGEALDAKEFIAQHPEIAGELRSFIDAEDHLRKLAAAEPVRGTVDTGPRSRSLCTAWRRSRRKRGRSDPPRATQAA